jgi:O-acetylhomoserine (thiol)-lyase
MQAHVENAMRIAQFLESHESVAWVKYPGLASSPERALVQQYLPRGAGGILTFGVRGGREAGERFIEALELWSHLANVGDVKSLVIHPASTTHSQLSDAELLAAGITPDMVRLSVGLEDVEDLIWDLEQGLVAARKSERSAAAQ